MSEEKTLLQLSYIWGQNATPVDWDVLPDEVKEKVEEDYYITIKYTPEEGLKYSRIVYFRKVKKFKKGITEINFNDNVVLGV